MTGAITLDEFQSMAMETSKGIYRQLRWVFELIAGETFAIPTGGIKELEEYVYGKFAFHQSTLVNALINRLWLLEEDTMNAQLWSLNEKLLIQEQQQYQAA